MDVYCCLINSLKIDRLGLTWWIQMSETQAPLVLLLHHSRGWPSPAWSRWSHPRPQAGERQGIPYPSPDVHFRTSLPGKLGDVAFILGNQ